jgi:hypothetical protein
LADWTNNVGHILRNDLEEFQPQPHPVPPLPHLSVDLGFKCPFEECPYACVQRRVIDRHLTIEHQVEDPQQMAVPSVAVQQLSDRGPGSFRRYVWVDAPNEHHAQATTHMQDLSERARMGHNPIVQDEEALRNRILTITASQTHGSAGNLDAFEPAAARLLVKFLQWFSRDNMADPEEHLLPLRALARHPAPQGRQGECCCWC